MIHHRDTEDTERRFKTERKNELVASFHNLQIFNLKSLPP